MKFNLTKSQITKFIFWPIEILIFLVAPGLGYYLLSQYSEGEHTFIFWRDYGMLLGLTSFIFFAIALTPGILGRFGIRNKFTALLMTYRREIGKIMFLFALSHYLVIKILPISVLNTPIEFPLYQTFGFLTFLMALALFITSNNYSQKILKMWWTRIHAFVYLMVWTVFLHVALAQGLTIISLAVFLLAFAELMSLANYYLFRLNLSKPEGWEVK